jgi:hypothetical protein
VTSFSSRKHSKNKDETICKNDTFMFVEHFVLAG